MMRRKAAESAIQQLSRGIASKSSPNPTPHDPTHENGRFSRKPRIDFSCIHDANDAIRVFRKMGAMSPQPSVRAYNNLLSVIARMKEYALALSVFDKMRQLGAPVNEYTMTILINCCCLLKRVDFAFAMLGSFFKQEYRPDVTIFNTLLKGLFLVGKVSEAERLFKKVLTFKLCEPDDFMILTIINGLCKAGQTRTSHDLFPVFEMNNYKLNIRSYSAVIDGLIKDGMVDDALLYLSKMTKKGIFPHNVTYNSIIKGLCALGRWNEVKYMLIVEMVGHGVSLNVTGFNILVAALCKERKTKEAEDILELMVRVNVCPDIVTYSTLMDGYWLRGQMDKAIEVFDSILERGCKHHIISYNSLIDGNCRSGNVDEVTSLFNEIPRKGLGSLFKFKQECKPNVTTFNTILKGLFSVGKVTEALRLFKKVLTLKLCEPDDFMILTVVNGLCKAGLTCNAHDLLQKLEKNNYKPDIRSYNAVIDGFIKEKMVDDALQLLSKMTKTGISPDIATYNSIIQGLCAVGRWNEVKCMLINEMVGQEVSLNVTCFNILVAALCKEGKMKEVEDILELMVRVNVCPDIVTYNTLIDGYCLRGQMDKAKEVFDSILERGLKHCIISYTSLIDGYCKSGDVDEAMRLFHEVPQKGLEHTIVSYSAMIHGLFCVGRFADWWKLFKDMSSRQIVPDLHTHSFLSGGLCHNLLSADVFSFLSKMEEEGIIPNIITYGVLINGLCKAGELDSARDLFNQLPAKGLQPNVAIYNMIIGSLVLRGLDEKAKQFAIEMERCGCAPKRSTYNVITQSLLKRNELVSIDSPTASVLLDKLQGEGKDGDLLQMIKKVVPQLENE